MRSHRFLRAAACAVVLAAGPAGASRERIPGPAIFGDNTSRQVVFPADFSFPFGGVRYKSCFVTSNGLICFHASTTTTPTSASTQLTFLGDRPRIAPLWVDLNPALGGLVTAGRTGPTTFEVRWTDVPVAGNSSRRNTFGCILHSDGKFDFIYGALDPNPGSASPACFVGFSTGNANTRGLNHPPSDFTTAVQCPSPLGAGSEAAMYQFFSPASGAAALANRCLRFMPALAGSGRLTMTDDDFVEIAIQGWTFPFHGNRYTSLLVCSNGSLELAYRDTEFASNPVRFTQRGGRIAPAWADLNPGEAGLGLSGTVMVLQTATDLTVAWIGVPWYGLPASSNTFSVTIRSDGAFAFLYGSLGRNPPTTHGSILVGQTGGYPVTTGAEVATPLSAGVNSTVRGAVFDYTTIASFPWAGTWVLWDNAHAAGSSAVPLGNNETYELPLAVRPVQFAGVRYASVFVHSDGCLTFGGADLDGAESAPKLLSLFPRIAAAWDDLNPSPASTAGAPEGAVRAAEAPGGGVNVSWSGVFESPSAGSNTFSIALQESGAFALTYGPMTLLDCIVGHAAGGDRTTGAEAGVNLSSRLSWGVGIETAIYEVFTPTSPIDLAQSTRSFAGASPILLQAAPASPGQSPVVLGAGPWDGGRSYAFALALGSVPGIQIGSCPNLPMNLDPMLVLMLVYNGLGIVTPASFGTMDGFGQQTGWPVRPSASPVVLNIPAGLGALQLTFWMGFVTWPGNGGDCPFGTISPALPLAIP
jgi:hypothetical protein